MSLHGVALAHHSILVLACPWSEDFLLFEGRQRGGFKGCSQLLTSPPPPQAAGFGVLIKPLGMGPAHFNNGGVAELEVLTSEYRGRHSYEKSF